MMGPFHPNPPPHSQGSPLQPQVSSLHPEIPILSPEAQQRDFVPETDPVPLAMDGNLDMGLDNNVEDLFGGEAIFFRDHQDELLGLGTVRNDAWLNRPGGGVQDWLGIYENSERL